jgi:hypothetical protein
MWLAGGLLLGLMHTAFVASSAAVVSAPKSALHDPPAHAGATMAGSEWRGSGRTLAVNPRDGMVDPGTVPAVGIELRRVYL